MLRNEFSTSIGIFLLRVAAGGMMLLGHGWSKLSSFGDLQDSFPDPLGIGSTLSLASAVGAEVGCSLLLILGILTRWAALPLAFTMGVALFLVHADDPWKTKELAAVYLAIFVVLALTGGGAYELETPIRRKLRGRSGD